MNRRISANEVKQFFKTVDKQFTEGGLNILRVKFIRDNNGNLQDIEMNYEENTNVTNNLTDKQLCGL